MKDTSKDNRENTTKSLSRERNTTKKPKRKGKLNHEPREGCEGERKRDRKLSDKHSQEWEARDARQGLFRTWREESRPYKATQIQSGK